MLVIMRKGSTKEQCDAVEDAIRRMGYTPLPVPGENRTAICITGNRGPVEAAFLNQLPGVLECIPVTKPYKLVSREVHPEDTVVEVSGVLIGSSATTLIAGPCSVETESRTLEIARRVQASGAHIFRAGAYKPRTSPYAFQGLGEEGLLTLKLVRDELGLPVVSEVMDTSLAEKVAEHVDLLQVGARNMQNFSLLKKLGDLKRPVLLKRGISATLEEWLMAAEYLLAQGNPHVVLCERGVRTFNNHSRNTLDLNVIPLARMMTHLPVIVDPSHGVGRRERVRHLARAALAAGAHGLMMEVHTHPDTAYSDAQQTIDVETFEGIVEDAAVLRQLEPLFGP
ncbi:MAG TPA: 3-deoxy-7-phosphoheptulonate synthase [Vicinamibacteria bacterium]|nr:3-deoxy-7-phosphoheptulonate synthase [Vicinamibacteria bacterium]